MPWRSTNKILVAFKVLLFKPFLLSVVLVFISKTYSQDTTKAIQLSSDATFVIQETSSPGALTGATENPADATFSVDVFMEKNFTDINGKALMHLESGQGKGLENRFILFSNMNRDADDDLSVRVTEAYYEEQFLKGKLSLTIGKIDPTVRFDNNKIANDETTQFLGRIFRNDPAIEFTDNSIGLHLSMLPWSWLQADYGVFAGQHDFKNIHNHLFNIGQATFISIIGALQGNYRLIGWSNSDPHRAWNDSLNKEFINYGFAVSVDQQLPAGLVVFGRYGWENPDVYNPELAVLDTLNFTVNQSWSAGLQLEGKYWKRGKDVLSMAAGQIIPSKKYRNTLGNKAETEGHIEVYYNFHFNDHLSITPDYQFVWNPYGKDVSFENESISVWGLRAQVVF